MISITFFAIQKAFMWELISAQSLLITGPPSLINTGLQSQLLFLWLLLPWTCTMALPTLTSCFQVHTIDLFLKCLFSPLMRMKLALLKLSPMAFLFAFLPPPHFSIPRTLSGMKVLFLICKGSFSHWKKNGVWY